MDQKAIKKKEVLDDLGIYIFYIFLEIKNASHNIPANFIVLRGFPKKGIFNEILMKM
jgi:hypothetical protein